MLIAYSLCSYHRCSADIHTHAVLLMNGVTHQFFLLLSVTIFKHPPKLIQAVPQHHQEPSQSYSVPWLTPDSFNMYLEADHRASWAVG